MMAFLVSSSILIVLSLGLPSMVSRDRMGRHPPKGRVGGEFLLARQTLLWWPRNGSNFREIRIPEARFPRRTLLGSSLNKPLATPRYRIELPGERRSAKFYWHLFYVYLHSKAK